jgi:hypothetical protein
MPYLSNFGTPFDLRLNQAGQAMGGGAPAQGHDKAWLGATPIDLDGFGSALAVQVVLDGYGNAVAVWQQHDGRRFHIWTNRYLAHVGWSVARRLHTHSLGDAYSPQISIDAQGNALAVWTHSHGERSSVWADRYLAHMGWQGAQRLQADLSGSDSLPKLAFDLQGNALAVWQHKDKAGNVSLWSNRYVAGAGWGALATMVEWRGLGEAQEPQIAFDNQGNAIMLWSQYDGHNAFHIWATRYQAGSGWCAAVQVTEHTGNAHNPQIAFDLQGNALVVVEQLVKSARSHIVSTRYSAGAGWSSPVPIDILSADDAYYPQIAVDASGCALAVWEQSDGERSHVWSKRYTPGTGWSRALTLEQELVQGSVAGDASRVGNAYTPQIAMTASGHALAVWMHYNGNSFNLWAAHYTPGMGWGAAQLATPNTGGAYKPQLAMNAQGNAMLVWEQDNGLHSNVWAHSYGSS